jgi:alpha-D-xyloside xylohydrolase
MFFERDNKLVFRYDAEELWVQPWGSNALRIRATKQRSMPDENWALQIPPSSSQPAQISITETSASITNGKIKAVISKHGKLTIYDGTGKLILEEYTRNRRDVLDPKCSAIEVEGREFKPIPGGDYHVTLRLESLSPSEKIFGMGQYQQPYLDLKGMDLELAQRNSQASVPFAVSSLGYGFLWNNPGIGRAVLGKNVMSFEALSTSVLDYWVVVGETPALIEEAYAKATGTVPMMPEYVYPSFFFADGQSFELIS